MGKSKVQGVDDYQFRNNRSVDVIRRGVNEVVTGEGVGGGRPGTRKNLPDDVKVLEEEGPASLSLR